MAEPPIDLGRAPIVDFDGTLARLDVDWQELRRGLGVDRIDDLWSAPGGRDPAGRAWAEVTCAECAAAELAPAVEPMLEALTGPSVAAFAVLTSNSTAAVEAFCARYPQLALRLVLVVGRESLGGPKTDFGRFRAGLARCRTALSLLHGAGQAVYAGDQPYELEFARRLGARPIDVGSAAAAAARSRPPVRALHATGGISQGEPRTRMKRMRIGLVGAGAMGSNHARVIAASTRATLSIVVDPDRARADKLAANVGADVADHVEAIDGCDAVIVASPTECHASVTVALIERGIPVLVEKPLAPDLAAAEAIVAAAAKHDVPLMCGFVERFNAAVITAGDLLSEAPIHLVSLRHSPQTPRIATSVIHDLLIHDIDLALGFLGHCEVERVAGAVTRGPGTATVDVADCTLSFTGGAVATLSASRASQRKIRSFHLTTPTELIEVDLLRQDVTVYRNVRQDRVGDTPGYRAETIVDIPFVRHAGEPLALQLEHFLSLVQGDEDPAAERATLLAPHRVAAALDQADAVADWAGLAATLPDSPSLVAAR